MPITPFLAYQAFAPEEIKIMSAAFVAACDALRLKICDDPATRPPCAEAAAIVAVIKTAAVPVTMIILLGFITKHSILVRSQPPRR